MDHSAFASLSRDDLIARARAAGVDRPELMTRVELADELVRRMEPDPLEQKRARGWLGVARDLVASVVESGLNLPDAAALIRGERAELDLKSPEPVATVTLAEIYATQGHVQRALAMLDEVIASEPDHDAALRLRDRLRRERPPRGTRAVQALARRYEAEAESEAESIPDAVAEAELAEAESKPDPVAIAEEAPITEATIGELAPMLEPDVGAEAEPETEPALSGELEIDPGPEPATLPVSEPAVELAAHVGETIDEHVGADSGPASFEEGVGGDAEGPSSKVLTEYSPVPSFDEAVRADFNPPSFEEGVGGDAADAPSDIGRNSEPPTSEPPTSEPPTSEPPTSEPPTSEPETERPTVPLLESDEPPSDSIAPTVVLVRARGVEPMVCWDLNGPLPDDPQLSIACVAFAAAAEGIEKNELTVAINEPRGSAVLESVPASAVLRVALGVDDKDGFQPLAIASEIELRDGTLKLAYRPPGGDSAEPTETERALVESFAS